MILKSLRTRVTRGPRTSVFTRPATWVLFAVIALAGLLLNAGQSPEAFPLISVDLEMSREEALAEARRLGSEYKADPKKFEEAASFYGGDDVESYLQQEGGGTEVYQRLLKTGEYYPYTWSVRHFVPEEYAETEYEFTPDGALWGFWITLDEEPGPALLKTEALAVAEEQAREFGIDLAGFKLLDSSAYVGDEGNRKDWEFEYGREDPLLKDASYRIQLYVNGDRFGGFSRYIEVPESYYKAQGKQDETRFLILGIVGFLSGAMFAVSGLFGLAILARRRQFEWRRAVGWGAVIAAAVAAAEINALPVLWFDYDTFSSESAFLSEAALGAALTFLQTWAMAAAALLVAEGLTRIAFPKQIQLWRVWRKPNASSPAVLGRTLGGYMFAAILLGYVAVFYAFMTRMFSWYSPAAPSADPDMLSTYVPFLGPFSMALQAGILEEALFRALPLAGAALLGRRFGRRRLFIGIGLVVQALVFAGVHVSYPTEPVYARLVEIFIPALVFGVVYLRFGLLPGILAHFTYDYALMGAPIFSTQDSSAWTKIAYVTVGLIPLLVVGVARLRAHGWTAVPDSDINDGWQRRARPIDPREVNGYRTHLGKRAGAALILVGMVGAVGWAATTRFTADAPPMTLTAAQTESKARSHLEGEGVSLKGYEASSYIVTPSPSDGYVLETYGLDTYNKLRDTYLAQPGWQVSFMKEGSKRTPSSFQSVSFDHRGRIIDTYQQVPPTAVRASRLSRDEAIAIALAAAEKELKLNLEDEDLDYAEYWGEPGTDWSIDFKVPEPLLKSDEARVSVDVYGDQAGDVYRYIAVPDGYSQGSWDRYELSALIQGATVPALGAVGVGAALFVMISLFRRRLSRRLFFMTAGAVFVAELATLINDWRSSTGPGFYTSFGEHVGISIVWSILLALGVGLAFSASWGLKAGQPRFGAARTWVMGVPLGVFAGGVVLPALRSFGPQVPYWPDYSALQLELPWLDGLVPTLELLAAGAAGLLGFGLLNKATAGWTHNRLAAVCGLVALCAAGAYSQDAGLVGPAVAAVVGAALCVFAFVVVLRHNLAAVIPAVATAVVLNNLSMGAAVSYQGSRWVVAGGCVLAIAAAVVWTRQFSRPLPETFGRRRSKLDFDVFWRRAVWSEPFALGLPVIEDRLLGQLRSITRTGKRARFTPARVVMKDGSVQERVYLAEASRYLSAWGSFPEESVQSSFLDVSEVASIEPSPHRLPAWMGRKVFRRARLIDGTRYFKLKLRDGRRLSCSTRTLADFAELPEGVSIDDVVSVRPERKPKQLDGRVPQALHAWCLYRDPDRLYPGAEQAAVPAAWVGAGLGSGLIEQA